MIELTEDEMWMVVENLVDSLRGLEEFADTEDTRAEMKALLDKLSPNWQEADTCAEVKTNSPTKILTKPISHPLQTNHSYRPHHQKGFYTCKLNLSSNLYKAQSSPQCFSCKQDS